MADVGALVDAIRDERELRETLVHRAAMPAVAAKFDPSLPPEFKALETLLADQ